MLPANFPDAELSLLGFDFPARPSVRVIRFLWLSIGRPRLNRTSITWSMSSSGPPRASRSPSARRLPLAIHPHQQVAGRRHRAWLATGDPSNHPRRYVSTGRAISARKANCPNLSSYSRSKSAGGRAFTAPVVPQPIQLKVGEDIAFLGYSPPPGSLRSGQPLQLTLYWQALGQIDQSYAVFVHVLNENGEIVAQQDSIPGQGAMPTQGWIKDEYIANFYQLELPLDLPSGQYQVAVGMYDPDTGIRLPITDANGQPQGDRILLPQPIGSRQSEIVAALRTKIATLPDGLYLRQSALLISSPLLTSAHWVALTSLGPSPTCVSLWPSGSMTGGPTDGPSWGSSNADRLIHNTRCWSDSDRQVDLIDNLPR